jgi:FKBP-type peptidyl-prolyl cis-trans isomerase FklB
MSTVRLAVLLAMLAAALPASAADPAVPETEEQKLSYAVGVLFGRNMSLELDVDVDAFVQGLRDVLEGKELRLPPEELRAVVERYQEQQTKRRAAEAEGNLAASRRFLEENKSKEGVQVLPGGVQYKVLRSGDGPKPTLKDTVVVHYRGTLIDGKEFDSSYARGEPATIPLANVIKGWQDAVTSMPVGSRWEVYVPPQLAYGDKGAGPVIGPNAALIFEIELIEISK